jgi:hypothetical protein
MMYALSYIQLLTQLIRPFHQPSNTKLPDARVEIIASTAHSLVVERFTIVTG